MIFPVRSSSLYALLCNGSTTRNGPSQFGESFPFKWSFWASPMILQTRSPAMNFLFRNLDFNFPVTLLFHTSSWILASCFTSSTKSKSTIRHCLLHYISFFKVRVHDLYWNHGIGTIGQPERCFFRSWLCSTMIAPGYAWKFFNT